MPHQRRIAFVTLGCKLNFSESSTFARQFSTAGYRIVRPVDRSDWYVVNTCSVTEHADKKCRNIIRTLTVRSRHMHDTQGVLRVAHRGARRAYRRKSRLHAKPGTPLKHLLQRQAGLHL